MTTLKTKLAVAAASVLALAVTAHAQTFGNITTSGFVLGSYQKTSGTGTDHLDIDSAMLKFTGDYKPVQGVISLYYVPTPPVGTNNLLLLDAYATYDAGGGWSVTGGRFLSWMGFESFFTVNNPEISFGYLNGIIAGYEDGARVVYTDKDWNAGVAVVDSALNSPTAFKGDGELKKSYGLETYFSYGGIKDNSLFLGISYDSKNGAVKAQETYDLWDQYQLDKATYVAGEVAYHEGGTGTAVGNATSYLALLDYTFNDQVSAAFRIGGDLNKKPTPDDTKYTFAPTYTINPHFSVRGEISYIVTAGPTANTTFWGVQGVFKF